MRARVTSRFDSALFIIMDNNEVSGGDFNPVVTCRVAIITLLRRKRDSPDPFLVRLISPFFFLRSLLYKQLSADDDDDDRCTIFDISETAFVATCYRVLFDTDVFEKIATLSKSIVKG